MDQFKYPSRVRLRLFVGAWLFLIAYAVVSQLFPDIGGVWGTLQVSHFSRVMFMDIGVLSTLLAGYIWLRHHEAYRLPFAIATLFLGSFALLPYLVLREWLLLRKQNLKTIKKS